MLEELNVHNYALIERASVFFTPGLNVLTGETGAGKSILVGALGLLFGLKGDIKTIRSGCDEAVVSGVVNLDTNSEALKWLKEREILPEDNRIIIRRILKKKTGRGSIYIQSSPVSGSDLNVLMSMLFDMHGQHEHQSLLKVDNHRKLIDRFGGYDEAVKSLSEDFINLSSRRKQYERLLKTEREILREMDILAFSVKEIEEAELRDGEEEELEREKTILSQHEKLFSLFSEVCEATSENRNGCLAGLRKARSAMDGIIAINPDMASFGKRLEDSFFEIEDIADTMKQQHSNMEFSTERLEACEEKLSVIYKLKKKYGNTVREIMEYCENSKKQIESMENREEEKKKLYSEISVLEKRLYAAAQDLSEKRKKSSIVLKQAVEERLKLLGMPKSEFNIEIKKKKSSSGKAICGSTGIDDIEFTISLNHGEPPRKLRKIASGGEISRIMLAIKSVIAETDNIGSLIFDEIDAGIGGKIAVAVGNHLMELSRNKQILCISHLASIAVYADNHIKVEKKILDNRTLTGFRRIDKEEKVKEIARMLSGDPLNKVSLDHAKEMLDKRAPKGAAYG